jgi:hypothetical protein
MTTARMSAFRYQVSNPAAIERALAPPIIQKVDDDKAPLLALIERARSKPKQAEQHNTPGVQRANLHKGTRTA